MAVAGGLKLDGRLPILASAVFTASLLLLVFGISHGRGNRAGTNAVAARLPRLVVPIREPRTSSRRWGSPRRSVRRCSGAAWCVFRVSRRTCDRSASKGSPRAPSRSEIPVGPLFVFVEARTRVRFFYPTHRFRRRLFSNLSLWSDFIRRPPRARERGCHEPPRGGVSHPPGSSLVGAAVRAPRITSKNLISVIFAKPSRSHGRMSRRVLAFCRPRSSMSRRRRT